MKQVLPFLLTFSLCAIASHSPGQSAAPRSALVAEPGTVILEHLLPKPVPLKVLQESPVFFEAAMTRAAGSVAPGTTMHLVGLSSTGYRIRGRARHGDVVGWMRREDLMSPDPDLIPNLKKLYERQQEVNALIAAKQIALGMTGEEVHSSLGKPNRQSSKVSTGGKEETREYVIYERVPQYSTAQDALGRIYQTVVYVKVETGSMSVKLKDNVVDSIEETKGNPLGGGGVKIVPAPLIFGW